jgi:flagellar biosynthesis component FlhA
MEKKEFMALMEKKVTKRFILMFRTRKPKSYWISTNVISSSKNLEYVAVHKKDENILMEFLANSDSEIYCKNKNSNIFEKCKNFLETYNEHDTYKLIKKEENG